MAHEGQSGAGREAFSVAIIIVVIAIAGAWLMAHNDGALASRGFIPDRLMEDFTSSVTTAPPGAAPPMLTSLPSVPEADIRYPGAVDFGDFETAPAMGHADQYDDPKKPLAGGSRFAVPPPAAPCADDDADAVYDGDELNVYQVRSRNDPERVWAGIYNGRKALVDRYVREELDETEDTIWWGRHET